MRRGSRLISGLLMAVVIAVGCNGEDGTGFSTPPATPDTTGPATARPTTPPTMPPRRAPSTVPPTASSDPTAAESRDDTGTTDGTAPAAGPGRGALDWRRCDDLDGLECATLAVPLDHDAPGGVAIDIALARRPADEPDDRIGSLVFNPGGPGASGLELLEFLPLTVPPEIAQRFDLVGFDPRGVGRSTSVDCELTLDDGIELVPDDDRTAWNRLVDRTRDELSTCTAAPGGLADLVGTTNAARDLDLIRAALGDDQLSYVGFSYGTRLGATYADLFPDRVRALVLDGAVKPTDDFALLATEQAGGFDRAFEHFAAACDADEDCLLQELGPTFEIVERIRTEIATVGSFGTDDPDRMLTPGELDLGIITALYSKAAWPFLAEAIHLADTDADGTLFQVLADSYLGRELDGTYSNQAEANRFIDCADDPARPGVDRTWARADALADASRYFGAALRASTGCLGLPDAVEPLRPGPASGAPPILVIGTTGDPATPYEWSVELADALESGVLYTVEGEGHTAFTSIECVAPVVGAYLIDLEVPADGASCTDDTGSDFFVPPGESDVDRVIAFFDCVIDEGVPLEPVTTADVIADPTGEQLFGDLDLTDPDVGRALLACSEPLLARDDP